jgi:hypothetical protein
MSEPIEPDTGTVDPQNDPTLVDVDALIADRDKWKSFARTHEDKWKAAAKDLADLRNANLPDSEKAIAEAEARGRQAALAEVSGTLAEAELRTQAALAGAEIPDAVSQYLDVARFTGPDGTPDTAAIATFVASLTPKGPKFAQNVGIGPQGTGAGISQLTREDLARMTPGQINMARDEGRLDSLLYGEH